MSKPKPSTELDQAIAIFRTIYPNVNALYLDSLIQWSLAEGRQFAVLEEIKAESGPLFRLSTVVHSRHAENMTCSHCQTRSISIIKGVAACHNCGTVWTDTERTLETDLAEDR